MKKAISIKHPWAWLICKGIKNVENRNWKTEYRGTLYIHASKNVDPDFLLIKKILAKKGIIIPSINKLNRGGIIGKVDLIDCITHSKSVWFEGRYGFILKNACFIPFKQLRGKLSIFTF